MIANALPQEDTSAPSWTFPILETKLNIPSSHHALVARPHLLKQLNAHEAGRLYLISAPAGFGKSTLVAEWVRQNDPEIAWLSLDINDNDLITFLNYLIASLQTVSSELGRNIQPWLQGSKLPPLRSLLPHLLNDFINHGDPLTLVLDDYHLMTNPEIHEVLSFLIDHTPEFVKLVISGRTLPPLSLSRLRSRNQLVELQASNLSFSKEEASDFLNSTMALNLNTEQVEILENRTEGWVAGLQLAALSIRGSENVGTFIAKFSGNNRYITDFLVEEVLAGQPEKIQQFLLQTSILERLSGDLCDSLLDEKQSQQILIKLEKSDLFLIPLDGKRRWFRYHHLFSETLRHLLKERYPDVISDLHRRASRWFEAQGFEESAIRHAIQAKDYERFISLFEIMASRLINQSRCSTLEVWFQEIPSHLVEDYPIMRVWKAWCALAAGDVPKLKAALDYADAGVLPPQGITFDPKLHDPRGIRGHVNVLRAYLARAQGKIDGCIELCHQGLKQLPEDAYLPRAANFFNLGYSYMITGKLKEAEFSFENAQKFALEEKGMPEGSLAVVAYQADLKLKQGELKQAERIALKCIEMGKKAGGGIPTPVAGYGYITLAEVYYEGDMREKAHEAAKKMLALGVKGTELMTLRSCLICARLEQVSGNTKAAMDYLEQAEKVAPRAGRIQEARQLPAWKARFHLSQGEMKLAMQWAENCGIRPEDPPDLLKKFEHNALIRVLLGHKQFSKALLIIDPLLKLVEEAGYRGDVIELLILKACAMQKRTEIAQSLILKALVLAETHNYVRVFLDCCPVTVELLVGIKNSNVGFSKNFVNLLLERFEVKTSMAQLSGLHENLSQRELEVLQLVAAGHSNQKIGEELHVSLNTVKTHTKKINSKLGVHNRTEAMAKAKTLHLI